jgi:hypothetical protein
MFFRFPWGLTKAEGLIPDNYALFRRLAAKELRTRPDTGRIFFLVNSKLALSSVMRACERRAFLTPLPKHFGSAADIAPTQPAQTTIYVHLNRRSGMLIDQLARIIRHARTVEPRARFLVKSTLRAATIDLNAGTSDANIAENVEILPRVQPVDDYFTNFQKCSVALLAYQREYYASVASSGVFAEAVGLGKPVVVPADTWMAKELAAGRGVGTVFAESTPECVAAALVEALQNLEELSAKAQELASSLRKEYSCRRALERILILAQEAPDMKPRYLLGEEIDFSDLYDSRCFMRSGWSHTEPWGVWTDGPIAEMSFRPDTESNRPLILRARVKPFLSGVHDRLSVQVAAGGQQVAEWTFGRGAHKQTWYTAEIPPRAGAERGRPLDISFSIDAPRSPAELGLSDDLRLLGLGFLKLSISAGKAGRHGDRKASEGKRTSPVDESTN